MHADKRRFLIRYIPAASAQTKKITTKVKIKDSKVPHKERAGSTKDFYYLNSPPLNPVCLQCLHDFTVEFGGGRSGC
jgi:hypothetical protein